MQLALIGVDCVDECLDLEREGDVAETPAKGAIRWPGAHFDNAFRHAASWLPPNAAFRCAFVARQVEVKG
jgi:hypothetical protein